RQRQELPDDSVWLMSAVGTARLTRLGRWAYHSDVLSCHAEIRARPVCRAGRALTSQLSRRRIRQRLHDAVKLVHHLLGVLHLRHERLVVASKRDDPRGHLLDFDELLKSADSRIKTFAVMVVFRKVIESLAEKCKHLPVEL